MATVKKSKSESLRAERAEVTRRRIAEAARRLFARDGYGATTLAGVAREAGVAVQTVYAVYGSKPGILRALGEGLAHQPEADALFEEAVRERQQERKLDLFARSIRMRWELGHDIVVVNEEAARTDPMVRREIARIVALRRAGIARLARTLRGVEAARSAAILDALTLPEVYRALVVVHGWSADDFEIWLGRVLKRQFG